MSVLSCACDGGGGAAALAELDDHMGKPSRGRSLAGSHAHHHHSHPTLAFSCSHTKTSVPSAQHTSMRAARPSLSLAPAYLKRLVAAAALYNACAHGLAAAGNGGPEKHIDFLKSRCTCGLCECVCIVLRPCDAAADVLVWKKEARAVHFFQRRHFLHHNLDYSRFLIPKSHTPHSTPHTHQAPIPHHHHTTNNTNRRSCLCCLCEFCLMASPKASNGMHRQHPALERRRTRLA